MVCIEKIEMFGKELNQLIIDKSDSSHPNRIVRFTEEKMKELNHHVYNLSVAWCSSQFSATMKLSKDDLESLIKNLQIIVADM